MFSGFRHPRRVKLCACCLGLIGKLGIDGHVKEVMEFYFNLCYFFACLTDKQNCFSYGFKGLVSKTPKVFGVFFWQTVTAADAYILSALLFKGLIDVVMLVIKLFGGFWEVSKPAREN